MTLTAIYTDSEAHGAIKLVQFQSLRPVDMCAFLEPMLVAVEFRGKHGQQSRWHLWRI